MPPHLLLYQNAMTCYIIWIHANCSRLEAQHMHAKCMQIEKSICGWCFQGPAVNIEEIMFVYLCYSQRSLFLKIDLALSVCMQTWDSNLTTMMIKNLPDSTKVDLEIAFAALLHAKGGDMGIHCHGKMRRRPNLYLSFTHLHLVCYRVNPPKLCLTADKTP